MSTLLAVSPLAEVAGGEVTLLRVLPLLSERGWRPLLAVPGRGRLSEAARSAGIPTSSLPLGPPERRSASSYAGAALALPLAARSRVAFLNGLPAQRIVPALATVRRPAVLRVNNPLPESPAAWSRPRTWRVIRSLVADSAHTAAECVAAGAPEERVHVLFPPAWAPGRRPHAHGGGGAEDPIVGFVGRLEPRKGVRELLEAAESLLRDHPRARLVIIGGPPRGGGAFAREVHERAARHDRIELRGERPDAASEIAAFDVLAVPSLVEPFGTVAAEAAAAGVPVVASRVGGLAEVVLDGETGLLVEPGDPRALAAALAKLLADDATARRLGARARELSDRFSPERYADRLDALLREAAG